MKLKPCPFCGSAPHLWSDKWLGWVVSCDGKSGCAAAPLVDHKTKDGAVKAWNKRGVSLRDQGAE